MSLRIHWPKIQLPKFDTRPLWKRLGLAVTVAAGSLAHQVATTGQLPHGLSGYLPAIGLGLASAIPAGATPAGILTPTGPGQTSLSQAVLQGAQAVIAAPAQKRAQAAQDAALQVIIKNPQMIQDALATLHGQTTADELGAAHAALASTQGERPTLVGVEATIEGAVEAKQTSTPPPGSVFPVITRNPDGTESVAS